LKNIRRLVLAVPVAAQHDDDDSNGLHAATTISWRDHHDDGVGGEAGEGGSVGWWGLPVDESALRQVRDKANAAWRRWRQHADPRQHVIYKYLRPTPAKEASQRERDSVGRGGGRFWGGDGRSSSVPPPLSHAEEDLQRLRRLVLQEEDGHALRFAYCYVFRHAGVYMGW